jgi:DNA-binding SARP family transcriptional activator/Tfp pilus assembly protein PilF
VEFRILGPLEVRSGAGKQYSFGRRKERQLVALLLLNSNRVVTTERIIDWLWDGHPPSSAAANLQSYLSQVRSGLGDGRSRLETHAGGYLLRAEPAEVDTLLFEDLAAQGRQAVSTGEHSLAVERFTRALGLWRAETVAEDLPLPDDVRAEAARLEQLRTAVTEELFEVRLALGQHRELVPELIAEARKSPLQEGLWVLLMLALYRSGRQAEALEAYQEVRGILASELGVDPGPDLQRTQEGILAADPALLATPAPSASTEQRPAQLPADLMSFTGRGEELSSLLDLAAQEGQTVVISAIDGMAGIGKTSLAVHAAHRLAGGFPDGQVFVDLHGFTEGLAPLEPAEVLDQLLRSLGVPGEQIPHTLDERAALWRTRLAGRRMLVLLDNAATEQQVSPLLPGAADCLVLVTSRRRLTGLDDIHPISLDVLSEPDAITLFTRVVGADRLADEQTGLIAEIVELCGRLPLAIRIAAARLRSREAWNLTHLADRLRDQQHRLAELEVGQRSVEAAIELSYAALDDEQQRMFRLVGLHPGPDVEPYAAAALARTEVAEAERLLDELLDVHLVQQHEPGRYRFHDLVRAHACACQAPEAGRRAALARLQEHYAHAASAAMDVLYPFEAAQRPRRPQPDACVPILVDERRAAAWLDTELANLLMTAERAGECGSSYVLHLSATLHRHLRTRARYIEAEGLHLCAIQVASRIGDLGNTCGALICISNIQRARGQYDSGVAYLEEALAIASGNGDRNSEVRARVVLGDIHRLQGRRAQAVKCYQNVLAGAQDTGDRVSEVLALEGLGGIYYLQGRHELTMDCLERVLRISREISFRLGELNALNGLGSIHRQQGRYELAIDYLRQAMGISRAIGYRVGELNALIALGYADSSQGSNAQAADRFRQALTIGREIGSRAGELNAIRSLGGVLRRQQQQDAAIDCYEQALAVARQLGDRDSQLEVLLSLGICRNATGEHEQAIACQQEALQIAAALGQADDEARAHDGLANACHALGQLEQARQHWRLALSIIDGLGVASAEATSADEIRERLAEIGQEA